MGITKNSSEKAKLFFSQKVGSGHNSAHDDEGEGTGKNAEDEAEDKDDEGEETEKDTEDEAKDKDEEGAEAETNAGDTPRAMQPRRVQSREGARVRSREDHRNRDGRRRHE